MKYWKDNKVVYILIIKSIMMMKLCTEKSFGEKVKKCGTRLNKTNKKKI